jgi:arsenate reductase
MSSTTWDTLDLDERTALQHGAARLNEEFAGVFDQETIETLLLTSFNHFAADATIHHFLPLMAERDARDRLQALAAGD